MTHKVSDAVQLQACPSRAKTFVAVADSKTQKAIDVLSKIRN